MSQEHEFYMSDNDLFELYSNVGLAKTILIFKGILTQDILVVLAEMLTNNLSTKQELNHTKKMFFIFVELAQNIHRYSAERVEVNEKEVGAGIVLVNEYKDFYRIISGNRIRNSEIDALRIHCEELNKMTEQELKQTRKGRLKRKKKENQRGAGVGLIDVARKSGNPIEIKFKPIDSEHSFLSFFIKLDKGSIDG